MAQGTQDAKYLLEVIKRQDKSVIEYRVIQNLTRNRFKKAMHLKATLLNWWNGDLSIKQKMEEKHC